MWCEHPRHRRVTERLGLMLSRLDELTGGDEHTRDATQLEITDVVHTARRAAPSIGERLDHHLALGGDLVTEVDRGPLGEGRLLVALDVGADRCEPLFEAVEEDVTAWLRDVQQADGDTLQRPRSGKPSSFRRRALRRRVEHETGSARDD